MYSISDQFMEIAGSTQKPSRPTLSEFLEKHENTAELISINSPSDEFASEDQDSKFDGTFTSPQQSDYIFKRLETNSSASGGSKTSQQPSN